MYGVLAGLLLAGAGGGYFYFTDMQETIEELRELNVAYELKFETQAETIDALQEDFETQTKALSDLQVQAQAAQREMNRYLDIFKRHNLSKLAAAKPGLIETRVNKGTKDVFDSIENDTRSVDSLDNGLQLAPTGKSAGSKTIN